ncbi:MULTISPECIES: hypothetical protein [unclassified Candidatus Frackibacter]|uniref:hypothetical protein n=1 Tax=unclassified Candidatus Frackibacter TaxID=2648818 RepID=UPI00079AF90A|nr:MULTISPECIES: hypothetical protein [unclassified Candidatus Frackibacter]KXS43440.1 MAG: hypothetical protein AWU54_1021 [Candidatus Frackibacter sp. T328-2]SDC57176.1 hypothetical protein SAMN04515661_11434 [Candidatus Frackibacter sp. WG11]SEM71320.1 hypothetical protein SAMN04488698_11334 [Candidatus Frackibacter sp. WG12]SFL82972.1 hypothetical protein SAMN04488699_11549 [Candidatus Frackibacter sp. WG13]
MYNIFTFLVGGAISGAVTAYAMDMSSSKELVQGAIGGMIAALTIVLLLPQ